ncbi:MAG: hypothetical protein H0T79_12750 [Deltaproteobacteria bacterium]|nr:hypothetical protein [Deltaproteobacteria bacterium]
MRNVLWCLASLGSLASFGACSTDSGPQGYATFSGPEPVLSARVAGTYVTYNGTPLHAWTISLTNVDGCTTTGKVLDLEINIGVDGSTLPLGDIPLRAAEPVQVVPSALLRYNAVTATSGIITLDFVSPMKLNGSFVAMTSDGELTGSFDGPICSSD